MVNKYTTIKERFKQVAKNQGISYEKLYEIIEMTDGSFKGSAINRPINSDAIVKLYTFFPDINLHWLITGEKKREENRVLEEPEAIYKKPDKDLLIEVLNENRLLNKKINALQETVEDLKKDSERVRAKS